MQHKLDQEKLKRVEVEARMRAAAAAKEEEGVHAHCQYEQQEMVRKHRLELQKLKNQHRMELERASVEVKRAWRAVRDDSPPGHDVPHPHTQSPERSSQDEAARDEPTQHQDERAERPSIDALEMAWLPSTAIDSVETARLLIDAAQDVDPQTLTDPMLSLALQLAQKMVRVQPLEGVTTQPTLLESEADEVMPSEDVTGWSLAWRTARVTLHKAVGTDPIRSLAAFDMRRCTRCGLNDLSSPFQCEYHPFLVRGSNPAPYSTEWHTCREAGHQIGDPPCQALAAHDYQLPVSAVSAAAPLRPADADSIIRQHTFKTFKPSRAVPPVGDLRALQNRADKEWQTDKISKI